MDINLSKGKGTVEMIDLGIFGLKTVPTFSHTSFYHMTTQRITNVV